MSLFAMIESGGKSMLQTSDLGVLSDRPWPVLLHAGRSIFPFATSPDLKRLFRWVVYNPGPDVIKKAIVGFAVGERTVGAVEFEMKPYTAYGPEVQMSIKEILTYLDLPVPPAGEHVILDLIAGRDRVVTDAIRRKIVIEEGLPEEGQFPLWVIPAVGGGIIALGVTVQLLERPKFAAR